MDPRSWLVLALLLASCGEAKVPHADATGWGSSRAVVANEVYPARYPLLSKEVRSAREAEAQRQWPGWRVSLAFSGFFAAADKHVPLATKLDADEIADAQHFIDGHLALFGLVHSEPLKRWHDGLYFISPVDDPRYGISLLHNGSLVVLTGHLWPGFTMRSAARKDPRALLAPWLGRQLRTKPEQMHPCDPVHDVSDCPGETPVTTFTIGIDTVSYAVYARATDTEVEVREILVLPLFSDAELVGSQDAMPPSVDARTGEPLLLSSWSPTMCEEKGACPMWGWFQDESHLDFNVRDDQPRIDLITKWRPAD